MHSSISFSYENLLLSVLHNITLDRIFSCQWRYRIPSQLNAAIPGLDNSESRRRWKQFFCFYHRRNFDVAKFRNSYAGVIFRVLDIGESKDILSYWSRLGIRQVGIVRLSLPEDPRHWISHGDTSQVKIRSYPDFVNLLELCCEVRRYSSY